jgi:hypothetical protein
MKAINQSDWLLAQFPVRLVTLFPAVLLFDIPAGRFAENPISAGGLRLEPDLYQN